MTQNPAKTEPAKPPIVHLTRPTAGFWCRFQFSLREMLIWFTLAAVIISAWKVSPKSFGPYSTWLFAFAATFRLLTLGMRDWPSLAETRRKRRFKRFRSAFWVLIPICACLNLIPYWQTYGSYQTDCLETIGWPLPFRSFGGCSPRLVYYPENFMIDCFVCIAMTTAAGYVLMDEGRWLKVQFVKLIRGRSFLKFRMG